VNIGDHIEETRELLWKGMFVEQKDMISYFQDLYVEGEGSHQERQKVAQLRGLT
jgi:hypothetical protein